MSDQEVRTDGPSSSDHPRRSEGDRAGTAEGAWTPLSPPQPFFRVRLINIDHVLTTPGRFDRTESAFNAPGQPLRRVPVLRIFGATPAGQRVCAHIHGVFPYCYVPYKASLEPNVVLPYIHRLGKELNLAIAASLRRDPSDADKAQFIAAIHLCKGVPFYGYHVGWRYFLKIYFVDPSQSVRIATILQSGKVMATKFQPYEVHVRYNLQFMLDFNLFGCDYIDFEHVLFRTPVPEADPFLSQDNADGDEQRRRWTTLTVPTRLIQSDQVSRNSFCEIEIDCHCIDILNRFRLNARNQHNTFDERSGGLGASEALVPSLKGLWEEEQVRRINAGLSPSIPPPESLKEQRRYSSDESPSWLATDRFQTLLRQRLDAERKYMKHDERYPSAFVKTAKLDHHIVTAFDSVLLLHGIARHDWYKERKDICDFDVTQSPMGRDSIYDLERQLTQNSSLSKVQSNSLKRKNTDSEDQKEDLRDGKGKTIDGDGDGYETPLLDGQVDLTFFSSQAFQTQMRQAESETRAAERSSDESEVDDQSAGQTTSAQRNRKDAKSDVEKRKKASSVDSASPSLFTKITGRHFSSPSENVHNNAVSGNVQASVRFRDEDDEMEGQTKSSSMFFKPSQKGSLLTYAVPAPSRSEVTGSFAYFGQPTIEHKDPFYSNALDVPKAREYAGRTFTFTSVTLPHLKLFESTEKSIGQTSGKQIRLWEFGRLPQLRAEIREWTCDAERRQSQRIRENRFRRGPVTPRPAVTQAPSYGFKLSQREQTSLVQHRKQHMTILAVEILTCTRGALHPDPVKDPVEAIAYSFQNEDEELSDTGSRPGLRTGLIIVNQPEGEDPRRGWVTKHPSRLGLGHYAIDVVESELELFNALIDLVRLFDPEILVGYEIHASSWGYLVERASMQFDFDLTTELGRVNSYSTGSRDDRWGATQYSSLRFTGRHTLNIWRLMRGELALSAYSYENVIFHLLRKRVPKFDFATITGWYASGEPARQKRALQYYIDKAEMDLELIDVSELVFRTSEFARIYGIDFFSVISRGSQFKVESVMFRIAKPESFLLPSPSQQQVGIQNAAEDLPLVMEPLSAFYKGPVLVLDFQSLYPSLMIAYNICYSTCLGRVSKFRDSWKIGYTSHDLPRGLLPLLEKDCFIAPNGILYVKSRVRQSLLAKMLKEILDTRVMVKASIKGNKGDRNFVRLQNARQLSLKLLANVTYGYTSATFSGRMPCAEVADSIVRCGRETLERAIAKIHSTAEWGAQVVYGDTDSLFIYLENRSKDEAFQLGNVIADAITADNPRPIKLKFEKVYLPSVLLAKKRYVGFMYESPSDVLPEFNAKGIETVRRDGFPAQQRMVEACIRILFRTQDLSQVKAYCQRQWMKILQGRVSVQDFIFAKEVKLGSYSDNGVPPPGAALAAKRMLLDKRSQCQYGERVPYVISQGTGKTRLIDLARDPLTMLHDKRQAINGLYYITRGLIPPLSRIFNLMGADVEAWFRELPKVSSTLYSLASLMRDRRSQGVGQLFERTRERASNGTKLADGAVSAGGRLLDHYRADLCLVCHLPSERDICQECLQRSSTTACSVINDLRSFQHRQLTIDRICASCASASLPGEQTPCVNIDCPILYDKYRTLDELEARQKLADLCESSLPLSGEPIDGSQQVSLQW